MTTRTDPDFDLLRTVTKEIASQLGGEQAVAMTDVIASPLLSIAQRVLHAFEQIAVCRMFEAGLITKQEAYHRLGL